MRSKAWPLLLDLKDLPDWDNISGEELERHHEYNQVVLDVNRSIKRFPPSIEDSRRIAIQDELIATIVTILSRNPGLHYYQVSIFEFQWALNKYQLVLQGNHSLRLLNFF